MDKNFNRHVTKDALQIANEHIERCSKSLVRLKIKIRMQIKIRMTHYSIPINN